MMPTSTAAGVSKESSVSKAEIIRAVQNEAKSGDRKQIFESYRERFPNPAVLATAIAGTAREEDQKKYRILNLTLAALLALSGVLKVLTIWAYVPEINPLAAVGLSVLGLAISLAFAYSIYRFTAAMYGLITMLAALALLNTLLHAVDDPIGSLVMLVFLGAILTLSIVLKQKLFPGLKLFGVKMDGAGQYNLG
jgi:hypothetical protein